MGCGSSKPAVDEVNENGKRLKATAEQPGASLQAAADGKGPITVQDVSNPLQGMGPTQLVAPAAWASTPDSNGNNGKAVSSPQQQQSSTQEMVLEVSSDEDNQAGGIHRFDMPTWKRFYTLNKNKPNQLLRFLWKRFNPDDLSLYCITYRHQGALTSPYQGDNVMYGFRCRVEELLGNVPAEDDSALEPNQAVADLFGVMHTLVDKVTNEHKVVGLLMAHGDEIGPLCLEELLELSDWVVQLADVSDPCVKTFVSQLITSQPPSPQYLVAYTRTV